MINRNKPGYLITLEGGEGSGKTLAQQEIITFLQEHNLPHIALREPGGTNIGDQIRVVLDSMDNYMISEEAEVLLFQASRAQLTSEVLLPSLQEGKIVVLDRFWDSTIAYQGYGHGIDFNLLKILVNFAAKGLVPDLTILLDVDSRVGLERKALQNQMTRFEQFYDYEYHSRVNAGYREMAGINIHRRWETVNANLSLEWVRSDVIHTVEGKLINASFIESSNNKPERFI